MTNHPITPPPELVQQWWEEADQYQDDPKTYFDYVATDQDLAAACREWIKGCTCAARDTPQECKECTDGFLQAVLDRARRHGLEIGANSLEALPNG